MLLSHPGVLKLLELLEFWRTLWGRAFTSQWFPTPSFLVRKRSQRKWVWRFLPSKTETFVTTAKPDNGSLRFTLHHGTWDGIPIWSGAFSGGFFLEQLAERRPNPLQNQQAHLIAYALPNPTRWEWWWCCHRSWDRTFIPCAYSCVTRLFFHLIVTCMQVYSRLWYS